MKKSKAVREKIKRGNLSVTNAAMVGSFLRDKPKENVEDLVEKVEGKTKRECEQVLNQLRGDEKKPRRTIAKHTEDQVRLSLSLKNETYKKLKKLLDLHAHKGWDLSNLIDHMAKEELAAIEKKKTVVRGNKIKVVSISPGKSEGEKTKQTTSTEKLGNEKTVQVTSPGNSAAAKQKQTTSPGKSAQEKSKQTTSPGKSAQEKSKQTTSPGKSAQEKSKQTTSPGKSSAAKPKQATSPGKSASANSKQVTSPGKPANPAPKTHGRYIKKSVRAQVWTEAGGRCQHCGSERALEFDHCKPFAWGGGTDPANLRLLCRECNRRQAVKAGLAHKAWKAETHQAR